MPIVPLRRFFMALACIALPCLHSLAENPDGHETLQKSLDAISADAMPFDENSPYFLLVGLADDALAAADYDSAIGYLQQAIDLDFKNPSNALLYSNIGMAYCRLERFDLALDAFNNSLDIAPAMTTVRTNRALLYLRIGRDADAYDDFAYVIDRDSVNATARYYHGLLALYSGKLDVARNDLETLASVKPDEFDTWLALASLYSMTGQFTDAVKMYLKVIDEEPEPEYYAALASCYIALEQYSEASATLNDAIALYDDYAELYYWRAVLRKATFRYDDAHADANKAIALGADKARVNAIFSK